MVENNEIDIGIVEGPVNNKNLVSRVCWDDELVIVTPPGHELASAGSVAVDQMLEYPFISREEGSGTREVISEHLNAAGREIADPDSLLIGTPVRALYRALQLKEWISRDQLLPRFLSIQGCQIPSLS